MIYNMLVEPVYILFNEYLTGTYFEAHSMLIKLNAFFRLLSRQKQKTNQEICQLYHQKNNILVMIGKTSFKKRLV